MLRRRAAAAVGRPGRHTRVLNTVSEFMLAVYALIRHSGDVEPRQHRARTGGGAGGRGRRPVPRCPTFRRRAAADDAAVLARRARRLPDAAAQPHRRTVAVRRRRVDRRRQVHPGQQPGPGAGEPGRRAAADHPGPAAGLPPGRRPGLRRAGAAARAGPRPRPGRAERCRSSTRRCSHPGWPCSTRPTSTRWSPPTAPWPGSSSPPATCGCSSRRPPATPTPCPGGCCGTPASGARRWRSCSTGCRPVARDEIAGDFAAMLAAEDLGDAALFVLTETVLDRHGLLPELDVAPIKRWLDTVARDLAPAPADRRAHAAPARSPRSAPGWRTWPGRPTSRPPRRPRWPARSARPTPRR